MPRRYPIILLHNYICVVHECYFPPKPDGVGNGKDAHYYHRFVFWDKDWNIVKISKQFKFMDTMIEFVCGLAEYQGDLLITFGYQDNASYILKMPFNTLNKLEHENLIMLQSVNKLQYLEQF